MSFASRVIDFNKSLSLEADLPEGIEVINPFEENEIVSEITTCFYEKYYDDNQHRKMIVGINPGRLGAGITGVPFTDTKRLSESCGINIPDVSSHEPSSVFVYEVIERYGGAEKFYKDFYIHSVCPLGFVINKNGRKTNYNYYDSKKLLKAVKPFIIENLQKQISFGIETDECFCLGTGKNFNFLSELNKETKLFKKITPLEHPRYIVQYKKKEKEFYINKYIKALES